MLCIKIILTSKCISSPTHHSILYASLYFAARRQASLPSLHMANDYFTIRRMCGFLMVEICFTYGQSFTSPTSSGRMSNVKIILLLRRKLFNALWTAEAFLGAFFTVSLNPSTTLRYANEKFPLKSRRRKDLKSFTNDKQDHKSHWMSKDAQRTGGDEAIDLNTRAIIYMFLWIYWLSMCRNIISRNEDEIFEFAFSSPLKDSQRVKQTFEVSRQLHLLKTKLRRWVFLAVKSSECQRELSLQTHIRQTRSRLSASLWAFHVYVPSNFCGFVMWVAVRTTSETQTFQEDEPGSHFIESSCPCAVTCNANPASPIKFLLTPENEKWKAVKRNQNYKRNKSIKEFLMAHHKFPVRWRLENFWSLFLAFRCSPC